MASDGSTQSVRCSLIVWGKSRCSNGRSERIAAWRGHIGLLGHWNRAHPIATLYRHTTAARARGLPELASRDPEGRPHEINMSAAQLPSSCSRSVTHGGNDGLGHQLLGVSSCMLLSRGLPTGTVCFTHRGSRRHYFHHECDGCAELYNALHDGWARSDTRPRDDVVAAGASTRE